jgi:hypothetical protein
MTQEAPDTLVRWTRRLGFGGLLPFVLLALGVWLGPASIRATLVAAQVRYAAAILTFVGALHWGIALASPGLEPRITARALAWGIAPSLYCWLVALLPARLSLPMLVAGLVIALAADQMFYRRYPVPGWFLGVRWLLTVGAAVSLAITALSPAI